MILKFEVCAHKQESTPKIKPSKRYDWAIWVSKKESTQNELVLLYNSFDAGE